MKNIKIERIESGTYVVKADTERFGEQEIMFESYSEAECVQYILRAAAFLLRATRDPAYLTIIADWMGEKKNKQIREACSRNCYLTSVYNLEQIYVYESENGGTYVRMEGTRTTFTLFIDRDGLVKKRAPAIKSMKECGFYKGNSHIFDFME